jgi:hypothetical protein
LYPLCNRTHDIFLYQTFFFEPFSWKQHLINKKARVAHQKAAKMNSKWSEIMKKQIRKFGKTNKIGKKSVCAMVFIAATLLCYGTSFACPGSDKDVSDDTAFLDPTSGHAPIARFVRMKQPARSLNRPVTINREQTRQICPRWYYYDAGVKKCMPIPR